VASNQYNYVKKKTPFEFHSKKKKRFEKKRFEATRVSKCILWGNYSFKLELTNSDDS